MLAPPQNNNNNKNKQQQGFKNFIKKNIYKKDWRDT